MRHHRRVDLVAVQFGSLVIGWDGRHVHIVLDVQQRGRNLYVGPERPGMAKVARP